MKISLRWLEEVLGAKIEMPIQDLEQTLLKLGFEVSGIHGFSGCRGVVTAHVIDVKPHPNADRLRIVTVTDGTQTTEVVCGAPNVKTGQKVFWAKVGAALADGTEIKEAAIRGVKSPGMLCSAVELGAGEDPSGLWELDASVNPGMTLEELLNLDDAVLDLEITPNRPDCLSHIGIARELSSVLGVAVPKPGSPVTNYAKLPNFPLQIENPSDCPLYIAKKIEGVSCAASPAGSQLRLIRAGIRPINDLVDITNLALLELGQPLHAFDADKLEGGKIIVRRAKAGERILALDGKTYDLNPDILIIADEKNPVAIAGIMGGEETAVGPDTKSVLLESAVFDRRLIRQTRKKLNLASESSVRFERGVTRWSCIAGSAKAEAMILASAGGRTAAYCDSSQGTPVQAPETVMVRISRVEKILGEKLSVSEIEGAFHKLGVSIPQADREKFTVQSPEWRLDLESEIDYIEEIARLRGYDQIPSAGARVHLPRSADAPESGRLKRKVKTLLQALSFQECCNYGLIPEKTSAIFVSAERSIRLANPLSQDQAILRPSLVPELLKNLGQNFSYRKNEARLYEAGKVFQKGEGRPLEKTQVAGAASRRAFQPSWNLKEDRPLDFFWIKGVVEKILSECRVEDFKLSPLQTAEEDTAKPLPIQRLETSRFLHPHLSCNILIAGGKLDAGHFGTIHPRLAKELDLPEETVLFEIDLEALEEASLRGRGRKATLVSRTPFIKRDCSIWVEEALPWGQILSEIRKTGGPLLENCKLFDLYKDKEARGLKSLSFTLTFRHPEKTLEDETANQARDKIVEHLGKKFKAELRSK